MKGVIKIEFILGVVIFVALIIYIAMQVNSMFLLTSSDSKIDSQKMMATTVLNMIAADTTGIAYKPYVIPAVGIDCGKLEKYNLSQYRFSVYSGNDTVKICGSGNVFPADIFGVKYITIKDGDNLKFGRMTLELW